MKKAFALALLCAAAASAQLVETIPFRVNLLPSNEVPAITSTTTGGGTILVHVVRNNTGQIISGSVDFMVNYNMAEAVTLTGMHIHQGAAGTNGPVTIDSGLSADNSAPAAAGPGRIERQGSVAPGSGGYDAALQTIQGMLQDPS